jgi:Ca-activated chloride channel family protein
MKKVIWVLLHCLSLAPLYSQYYLRGEIKDNNGHLLEGVKIVLASHGASLFFSGNSGTFGIPATSSSDTISLSLDGYEVLNKKLVDTRQFQSFVLKMLPATAQLYKRKLSSATTNMKASTANLLSVLGESYSSLVENSFINAAQYPETGFALNVDKASYSNIRRFISNEMLVPTDAIRIEEMLNYFNFSKGNDITHPHDFHCRTRVTTCPWEEDNRLLFINVTAPKLNLDSIPPSNLVFLIDISGSMDKPNRLPLLQSAFKMLVDNLRPQDTISLVTYGGGVGIALPPTGGKEKQKIKDAIDSLSAEGDTPGENAIRIAYDLTKRSFIPKGNNRVILATDGDFNVGQASEKELEDLIVSYRQTGIYLTCLGVGMGNYKDSKLETLAKKGNGNFAYIDNLAEAQKILVTEFTQTMYSVADNAYLKIDFNPTTIKEYRLIGFDNKKNAAEDSTSELEGGEIGSGHSMMAIFEITPVKKDSITGVNNLAEILVQYKEPKTEIIHKQQFNAFYVPVRIEEADSSYRFAASIAMFGMVLRQSKYTNNYLLEDVLSLAKTAVNTNDMHQKEFLGLLEKAIKIYHPVKQRRNKAGGR